MTDTMLEYARETLADLAHWAGIASCEPAVDELASDVELITAIEGCVADEPSFRTKRWDSALELGIYRITLYALLREAQPAHAIETGVLHGLTSAFMLRALDRNQQGRLTSIDLPSYFESGSANKDGFDDTLPRTREPGWAVPSRLRSRWTLRLGSSHELLAKTLDEGPVGLFLHDSEHTYDTMSFELNAAWPALGSGGFVVCDNIDTNVAFFDFCRHVNRTPFVISQDRHGPIRFGIVRK